MTVREYLKDCNKYADATFIVTRARRNVCAPGYHAEYQTTPVKSIEEWEKSNLMDYYILNNEQCPINWLSGSNWKIDFDNGNLISLLVISKDDLKMIYSSDEQIIRIIKYIDSKIRRQ